MVDRVCSAETWGGRAQSTERAEGARPLEQCGEQGSMPDCIKSTRYVQIDSPDLMFDIEGLHPLLEEKKQHVQRGVTKTNLVI